MCISEPRSRKPNQQELCRARMCPKHLQPNVRKDTLRGRPKRLKRSLKHNHLMPTATELSCLLEVVAFWCFKSVKATWIRVLYSTSTKSLCVLCQLNRASCDFRGQITGGRWASGTQAFHVRSFLSIYLTFCLPVSMQEKQALRAKSTNILRIDEFAFLLTIHNIFI